MLHIVPPYVVVQPDYGLVESWKMLLFVLSLKRAVFNGYLYSYSSMLSLHQKLKKK